MKLFFKKNKKMQMHMEEVSSVRILLNTLTFG